eukprot:scaffold21024_cov55-Phaeocystis_antarctica.AAC.4
MERCTARGTRSTRHHKTPYAYKSTRARAEPEITKRPQGGTPISLKYLKSYQLKVSQDATRRKSGPTQGSGVGSELLLPKPGEACGRARCGALSTHPALTQPTRRARLLVPVLCSAPPVSKAELVSKLIIRELDREGPSTR